MTDTEFARAFERGAVPHEQFHHLEHLRLAWVYLHEAGSADRAADTMAARLRAFAAAAGRPQKYHQTRTEFWLRLLADARGRFTAPCDFAEVARKFPRLLEKTLPAMFYSSERLHSEEARMGWLAPDLRLISIDAAHSDPRDPPRDPSHRSVSR